MLKNDFLSRHLGSDDLAIQAMLAKLGLNNIEELLKQILPATIKQQAIENLPDEGLTEQQALAKLLELAKQNQNHCSMIGMGYYNTYLPAVIQRNILENPGWYTAYTPYQSEISQGRLFMLLIFQQLIIDLTGLSVANASLLDEATAACEAMLMCKRIQKQKIKNHFFVDQNAHPQVLEVLKGRAQASGVSLIIADPNHWEFSKTFGGILYYPNTYGAVLDYRDIIKKAHDQDNIVAIGTDLMALVQLQSPGELNADIAFGSAQRFGIPVSFGGPHAAFLSCCKDYKRAMPGRIIGVSKDQTGKIAYRMALQTREQHIRRDQATSNICTAQAFLAILSAAYAIYHGPKRLQKIAQSIYQHTEYLANNLLNLGYELLHLTYFDTICVYSPQAKKIYQHCLSEKINLRLIDENTLGISCDETTDQNILKLLIEIFQIFSVGVKQRYSLVGLPEQLRRQDQILTHPIFHEHQTETEFLRLVTKLQNKDFALDHSMIPLGSCTMKLNAVSQMQGLSWPQFNQIHPFAPKTQTVGYQKLLNEFESMMSACTGLSVVTLQPNSGAQGEYAGLLMIQSFLKSIGQSNRDICLIPASAHGTNPASAVMCGMKVVVVKTDQFGNIDIDDFRKKAAEWGEKIAACMITYPSTHGVFESGIVELTNIMHQFGGLVYLDGANLNAMIGCVRVSDLGIDVMHINLHKTFCIPHGGGGPGVGVVAAVKHLEPFLPAQLFCDDDFKSVQNKSFNHPVSSAPYGSGLLFCIPWMYIHMMGKRGLTKATQLALLNANYMKKRLSDKYQVLYTNEKGYVAHEFIIDARSIKEETGISEHDIAKRLMDYGFHAPTVSFPVQGGLMIEPTESESKKELDRFCDAMLCIFDEINKVKTKVWPKDSNPLKNAPHTQNMCIEDDWSWPYSRKEAAFPLEYLNEHKKWPSVARVDDVFGDRNLVCSCLLVEDYAN